MRALDQDAVRLFEILSSRRASKVISLRGKLHVLILPGAFYREYPQTGADGARVTAACASLGIDCSVLPIPSFASTEDVHKEILSWMRTHADQGVLFVSLSKSSMDLADFFILGRSEFDISRVRGWMSISGLITGTPLIQWFRRAYVRRFLVRMLFMLRGYDFDAIEQLQHDPQRARRLREALPEDFPIFHVIGFPKHEDLSSSFARRSYGRVAAVGSNDGGGFLLQDALELPGTIIPIQGQDHYLKKLDLESLLRKVFG